MIWVADQIHFLFRVVRFDSFVHTNSPTETEYYENTDFFRRAAVSVLLRHNPDPLHKRSE